VAVLPSVLPAFVEELPEGVRQVSLPTPFRVGSVNCYVLLGCPVTVIDPGTLQPGSLAQLRGVLMGNGLDFDDVEQVVVTHAHADHFGAAAVLAARSRARIVCGVPEVPSLLQPPSVVSRLRLFARMGVPDGLARSLIATFDAQLERVVRRAPPGIVSGVHDGDVLAAGGRELVCVVTPGHADGHLSLWDPAEHILFSGDHLLARIIPVPSLGDRDWGTRRRNLPEYLASLSRFVEMDPEVVLPGHGRAFTEIDVLAERLRDHSRRRADEVSAILCDGPATVFDVARRLQWQPAGARLVLGLAHAQGHLDLLHDAERVTAGSDGGVIRYRLRR
jgi:glyoxylase-like metal-dependent hydrolase (beta-lactamase superfamily II)